MSFQAELTKVSVQEFARRFRQETVPLSNAFSYFAAVPLGDEELREYLQEPIAALPPKIQAGLGKVSVVLVPYLERGAKGDGVGDELVSFEKPPHKNQFWSTQFISDNEATLVVAIKDQEAADYHYIFYRGIATLVADYLKSDALDRFTELLRHELRAGVHGEVDEEGWELKQELVRRQSEPHRETKLFRAYARQSFVDTLTLYLHGICCDIDIETGPRQLPSRLLRRRLELFEEAFPPPQGYAVFPEDLP